MPLTNWPPNKGPKPLHLQVAKRITLPAIGRGDFTFIQPKAFLEEQTALIETAAEHIPIRGKDFRRRPKVDDHVGLGQSRPKSRRRLKRETTFRLEHGIIGVGMLSVDQAHTMIHGYGANSHGLERVLAPKPLTIELIYPLRVGSKVVIEPLTEVYTTGTGALTERKSMSVGYVLWAVAQEYFRIYRNWKQYKIWGHALEDLVYTELRIRRGQKGDLTIAS